MELELEHATQLLGQDRSGGNLSRSLADSLNAKRRLKNSILEMSGQSGCSKIQAGLVSYPTFNVQTLTEQSPRTGSRSW